MLKTTYFIGCFIFHPISKVFGLGVLTERIFHAIFNYLHQSTAASTWGLRSPTPFGLVQNGFAEGFSYPGHFPAQTIFLPCCHLNDCRRAAHSFLKVVRLSSPFSCLSLARLRLLIFSLLISGNVHPNPELIFPVSVCAGNVTCRGRSVQCYTCSKWAHLKCSPLSLSPNSELLAALTPGAASELRPCL